MRPLNPTTPTSQKPKIPNPPPPNPNPTTEPHIQKKDRKYPKPLPNPERPVLGKGQLHDGDLGLARRSRRHLPLQCLASPAAMVLGGEGAGIRVLGCWGEFRVYGVRVYRVLGLEGLGLRVLGFGVWLFRV